MEMQREHKDAVIIKFDFPGEQTVGSITKIVGLVRVRYLVSVIDVLDLEANPRASRTGPVTVAIQESIENDREVFPFKTKGILLASSRYERMERGRVRIAPANPAIEGILDGGHNALAIGLYILRLALEDAGRVLPSGGKTWSDFKQLWRENRAIVERFVQAQSKSPEGGELGFYVPVELLIPRDSEDTACVEPFKNDLLEICAARNNNVQLQVSDKANQRGFFDELKELMDERNPLVSRCIAWKTNDGGEIRAQDLVALTWIPMNLVLQEVVLRDQHGRRIEAVGAQNIYRNKGVCLQQFERLMSSPEVTSKASEDYRHELYNTQVRSALRLTADLPELYDYIYEMFPKYYNANGGLYGRITAVKMLNEKRREKRTPFMGRDIETLSPDGYIVPLVYGLQALMERTEEGVRWRVPPMPFLRQNLKKIVGNYAGLLGICDYDPQKIGKNAQSYAQTQNAFKMAYAGIL